MPPEVSVSDENFVRRSLLVTAALGAIATIIMASHNGVSSGLSTAIGAAVGALNLWALSHLISILIRHESTPSRGRAGLLLVFKGLALLTGSAWLVSRPWMELGGFLVGFTCMVAGVTVGALWASPTESSHHGSDKGHH